MKYLNTSFLNAHEHKLNPKPLFMEHFEYTWSTSKHQFRIVKARNRIFHLYLPLVVCMLPCILHHFPVVVMITSAQPQLGQRPKRFS